MSSLVTRFVESRHCRPTWTNDLRLHEFGLPQL